MLGFCGKQIYSPQMFDQWVLPRTRDSSNQQICGLSQRRTFLNFFAFFHIPWYTTWFLESAVSLILISCKHRSVRQRWHDLLGSLLVACSFGCKSETVGLNEAFVHVIALMDGTFLDSDMIE